MFVLKWPATEPPAWAGSRPVCGGVLELTATPPPPRGRWCRCAEYLLLGGGVDDRGLLARCRGLGQDLHGVGVLRLEVADAAGRPGHRGLADESGAVVLGHLDRVAGGG